MICLTDGCGPACAGPAPPQARLLDLLQIAGFGSRSRPDLRMSLVEPLTATLFRMCWRLGEFPLGRLPADRDSTSKPVVRVPSRHRTIGTLGLMRSYWALSTFAYSWTVASMVSRRGECVFGDPPLGLIATETRNKASFARVAA